MSERDKAIQSVMDWAGSQPLPADDQLMHSDQDLRDAIEMAYDAGAAAERAAVVEWLKHLAVDGMTMYELKLASDVMAGHHKEPK